MNAKTTRHRVGELRPSQLLFSYGVGAIVDLPNIAAMVEGLHAWPEPELDERIVEPRLLHAVRTQLGERDGNDLVALRALPRPAETQAPAFGGEAAQPLTGLPVAAFPRWLLCPVCRTLGTIDTRLFELKVDRYRPERTRYAHVNCNKGVQPTAVPARFLLACNRGHLDDFPWLWFIHRGAGDCSGPLALIDTGVSGEAHELFVTCRGCNTNRPMSAAFTEELRAELPGCRGRRPQLGDFEEAGCDADADAILLGASNLWFPLVISTLAIPAHEDRLRELVERYWGVLEQAQSEREVTFARGIGQLRALVEFGDTQVWQAVEAKRARDANEPEPAGNLRLPEWLAFIDPLAAPNTDDLRLRPAVPPPAYARYLPAVVLAERLREVRALVGFTRILAPGDLDAVPDFPPERRAPLSRRPPTWVPAVEVRGEGIFLRFSEPELRPWESDKVTGVRSFEFRQAHARWRSAYGLDPNDGFPGLRYVLLHSFAHVLLRQLADECGYAAASIRERIYALPPEHDDGPMAGILLYTAATDSEGTLGGLVALGNPVELGRQIARGLERAAICASDPLCAEHDLGDSNLSLHGAACHACLFAPETSCERSNKYLDRALLTETFNQGTKGYAFFCW